MTKPPPEELGPKPGQVIEIRFPTFTARAAFHSDRELTVEIVEGDNTGFSDTVEYEVASVRDNVLLLSWQEHVRQHHRAICSTVTRVVRTPSSRRPPAA
jgi:hypothetical protein